MSKQTDRITKAMVREILAAVRTGSTLSAELQERGLTFARWYAFCRANGISASVPRGRRPTTYTPEVFAKVRALVEKGMFIYQACERLGIDYHNFTRWCRQKDMRVLAGPLVKRNLSQRRDAARKRMTKLWERGRIGRGLVRGGAKLTPREMGIWRQLERGLSPTEVARREGVGPQYVSYIKWKQLRLLERKGRGRREAKVRATG